MLTRQQMNAAARALVAVVAGFAVSLGVGSSFKSGFISGIDEGLFNAIVPILQASETFVTINEFLTQLGAIPVNFGMAIMMGLVAALVRRQFVWAVLVPATMAGAHAFQNFTIELIDREIPVEHVLGNSGGYYSGGVMRVVILTAMLFTLALPHWDFRKVAKIAIAAGLIEGLTRLTLGRHWPFDILAAIPIGLGIAWTFRTVAYSFLNVAPDIMETPAVKKPTVRPANRREPIHAA